MPITPTPTLPASVRLKLVFLVVATIVLAISMTGPAAAAGDDEAGALAATGQDFVPGEVLVQYQGEAVPETVELSANADVEAVAENLEERPGVKHATPNYIARISAWMPNDVGVNPFKVGQVAGWQHKQWNFLPCLSLCHEGAAAGKQSRGGANVLRAWRQLRKAGRPGAKGVNVAVLDTGVAYRNYGLRFRRNPDLRARTFLPGYDFVGRDRFPLDTNGHGTHVTATIAQATNNRRGLTGIAYGAKVMPVRVMDTYGFGTTENIIKGIRWATNHGARVISMSINFQCGLKVPPLEQALTYAHRKGVVIVGSSGNRGGVGCPSLPATSPKVISVGGTTESGCVANYTFRTRHIDIAAPGGGSAGEDCPVKTGSRPVMQVAMIGSDPSRYGIEKGWKGTSMAAAHVAAGAAMVIASDALKKRRGPRQVRERLLETARLPARAKGDPESGFGAGIINLGRATNPRVK
ncbi:MAG: S8 family serine peptidase, partial [Actinomycetota bacterium]|nr:S8 family serine peptidase [Actinomycetota bacterium]